MDEFTAITKRGRFEFVFMFSCFHCEWQSIGQTAKVLPKTLPAVDEPRLGRKYSDNFPRLRATRNGAAPGPWPRFRAATVRRASVNQRPPGFGQQMRILRRDDA